MRRRRNPMGELREWAVFGPWVEAHLGVSLECAAADPIPVVSTTAQPLWAARLGHCGLVAVRADWLEDVREVTDALSSDELFSVFGAYELSRVTLPRGYGVWGPSFFYIADAQSFVAPTDSRVAPMTPEQMSQVDAGLFWHCTLGPQSAGFGIWEHGHLVALATVETNASAVWEVGLDVVPDAKGRGLGRAVFGAAGRFALEQGRLVLGTVAPWNIPSTRTIRGLGMRHAMTALTALPAPMRVPPQPLGAPLPGCELRNYYPDWAMNQDILPRNG